MDAAIFSQERMQYLEPEEIVVCLYGQGHKDKQGLIKEQIWNVLICNCFANRVGDPLNVAAEQTELGLAEMAANKSVTRQLTNWTWHSARISESGGTHH
jgi:hypothetical protein